MYNINTTDSNETNIESIINTKLFNKNNNNSNNNKTNFQSLINKHFENYQLLHKENIAHNERQFQQILNCFNAMLSKILNLVGISHSFKQPCLAYHYFEHLMKNCVNLYEKIEDSCLRCFSKDNTTDSNETNIESIINTELFNKNNNNSNNNNTNFQFLINKTIEHYQFEHAEILAHNERNFLQILNCLNTIKNPESCENIPLPESNFPWATSAFKQPCLACHYFGHLMKNYTFYPNCSEFGIWNLGLYSIWVFEK
ncbi:hypothetical protein Glove_341g22 [Diversispora epigaea]|uniref:Uncharacterized protein n=1 Tax=Diversispora epigaea TaxID=1348612 RepID=A0A397HGK7_9GLOM|nr:hypothetical protein Glove_341g22 [Diversispora epigaea]